MLINLQSSYLSGSRSFQRFHDTTGFLCVCFADKIKKIDKKRVKILLYYSQHYLHSKFTNKEEFDLFYHTSYDTLPSLLSDAENSQFIWIDLTPLW